MKSRPHANVPLEIEGGENDPLAVVGGIAEESRNIERKLREWVARSRRAGHTWQEIGDALKVSRQSAWERFKDLDEDRDTVIDSLVGSIRRPPGSPTLEEIREMERRVEEEIEERKIRDLLGRS